MSRKQGLLLMALLTVGAVGWYWFRPELLFLDAKVNEAFPNAEAKEDPSRALAHGDFVSVAHETKGRAAVHQIAGGKRILRFTDFATSNGPDVRVYLVAADEAKDNESVTRSDFIELGTLKGNIGDQNYELPEGLDLATYRTAVIWCKRFSVNFAAATLTK